MKRNWPLIFSLTLFHAGFYFMLTFAAISLEDIIEQPRVYYGPDTSWAWLALRQASVIGLVWAVPMTVAAFFDGLIITRSSNALYFCGPRLGNPRGLFQRFAARWVLILGAIFLGLYWFVGGSILYLTSFSPHGLIWPAYHIAFTIEFAWAVLWLADLLRRRTMHTRISWWTHAGLTLLSLVMVFGVGVLMVE